MALEGARRGILAVPVTGVLTRTAPKSSQQALSFLLPSFRSVIKDLRARQRRKDSEHTEAKQTPASGGARGAVGERAKETITGQL